MTEISSAYLLFAMSLICLIAVCAIFAITFLTRQFLHDARGYADTITKISHPEYIAVNPDAPQDPRTHESYETGHDLPTHVPLEDVPSGAFLKAARLGVDDGEG